MTEDVSFSVKIRHYATQDTLKVLSKSIPKVEGVSWTISSEALEILIVANSAKLVRSIGDQVLAELGSAEDKLLDSSSD